MNTTYFTVIDANQEVGVKQQDGVCLNTARVQQHWFWRAVERIGVQNRLDHNKRVGDILVVQPVTVKGSLIRTVVEV